LAVGVRGERAVFRHLASLRELERTDSRHVAELQTGLLRDTLEHALRTVPFYRPWADESAHLSDPLSILSRMPVLEKQTLQERFADLRSTQPVGRYTTKTTGGSTGRPVTIVKNSDAIAREMAATWLAYGWFGVRYGDPSVRFWGRPASNVRRRARYVAADWAVNRKTLSAFGYSPRTLERYVRQINRFRPAFLYGYVSALEDLAFHLLQSGTGLDGAFLRSVITTSEVLTAPQRATLQRAFQVPVQNEYGCGEVGPIAYECPAGSLHLMATNHYIEIVDDAGNPARDGASGFVLITDLTNRALPLIRYRVGDIAAMGDPCGCGRPFPVLREVLGREYDFVQTRAGEKFHGEYFMYIFEDLRRTHPEVGQFKLIQRDWEILEFNVVLNGDGPAELAPLHSALQKRLPQFQCSVVRVDGLPRLPSGKMRVVENLMLRAADAGAPAARPDA
jgi:phenylacetate-CoA ligase